MYAFAHLIMLLGFCCFGVLNNNDMENSKPNSNKNKKGKERYLTVFSKGFARAYRRIAFFPEIRIQGKWLQDCGFYEGDSVKVSVGRGKIVIRKVKS